MKDLAATQSSSPSNFKLSPMNTVTKSRCINATKFSIVLVGVGYMFYLAGKMIIRS